MNNNLDTLIDKITSDGCDDIQLSLSEPKMYKNSGGNDLFGYPSEQLSKASIYYNNYCKNLNFDKAAKLLEQIKVSITIQELSLIYKKALLKNIEYVDFLKNYQNPVDIFIALCSNFSKLPEQEIRNIIDKSDEIYKDTWHEIITDEDEVSPTKLYTFYNSINFPVGWLTPKILNNDMAIAYRTLPILMIYENKFKDIFDYGGNSGESLSAISNYCNINSCYLIEENEVALNFAKWRDKILKVENINYLKESALNDNMNILEGKFDFGICTEVLEHVYDVEGTVQKISRLLKKGGVLYFSASFGFYPEPSHLKKNTEYFGKEDELMRKYNLKRISINFPLPLLSNLCVYIKE